MSFEPIETSRELGVPINLYQFIYEGDVGDSPASLSVFAYTDSEETVFHDGTVYEPIPISRDKIRASGTLDKSAMRVRMPRDVALLALFIVWPPSQPVTLIIRQGHITDPDSEFGVIWSGTVLAVERDGDECVTTGEPISSSLRRSGLRRPYSLGCPLALYKGLCTASEAAATVTATVDAIDGTTITLASGWEGSFDPTKFTEGMVKWTNASGGREARKILRVTGDDLALGGFLRDLAVTDSVSVVLGCNHLMTDCQFLHNVIHAFGGFAWIPTKNPHSLVNQFY
ncbi:MAG: phage BR0599 family protein [Alphaproteobacteria bacterium]|nr:phage BR0599 family protein [Alphaproteobacteria bacterium]